MNYGKSRDIARRHTKIISVIDNATRAGTELSVTAIARLAGVDRSYLYRHRALLAHLHQAQAAGTSTGTAAKTSRESLHADLANCQARSNRLHARVQQLERRLSEQLGEKTWRESGLGPPLDIDTLNHRIDELHQQNTELRRQLDEREAELTAARAANRELMIKANTPAKRQSVPGM